MSAEDDGSFVIFSENKLWYSSKKNNEVPIVKNKNINKIRNSAKNKRIVEFPIFDEIMKIETDSYWISFFNECAIGKLPRGFKYGNNILFYRIKSKIIEVFIPEDPYESSNIIKKFVYEHSGIISPNDLNEKRNIEEKRIANIIVNENIQWINIKNEKEQSILISLFAEKISEYYNLSIEESKILIQIIKIGVIAGYLNNENIIMNNGQIVEIIGLEFNEDDKTFSISKQISNSFKPVKKNFADETTELKTYTEDTEINVQNKKCLIKQWNKFVTDLNSKKIRLK
jgi:hypothetical protein